MNIRSGSMHPATIGEALTHLSKIILNKNAPYTYISNDDRHPTLSRSRRAKSSFLALGDVCMSQAPSLGTEGAPSAVEGFGSDVVLHFGNKTFGSRPRPPVIVSQDLETSFGIFQQACRDKGSLKSFTFPYNDESITALGRDLPDAVLRHLALTGALIDAPFVSGYGASALSGLSGLDPGARASLEIRLERALSGFNRGSMRHS
jgi:hypothetical protein